MVKIEEDFKPCNCSSIKCKCTCRKCAGTPHYEFAHRELLKGMKHKVRMCRPAFVMYLSGVAEGGEGKFTVPPLLTCLSVLRALATKIPFPNFSTSIYLNTPFPTKF